MLAMIEKEGPSLKVELVCINLGWLWIFVCRIAIFSLLEGLWKVVAFGVKRRYLGRPKFRSRLMTSVSEVSDSSAHVVGPAD